MQRIKESKWYQFLAFQLLILQFISVDQFSDKPIGNTTFSYTLYVIIIFTLCVITYINRVSLTRYPIVFLYLIWAVIGIIRGCFVAENYWENKALYSYSVILLMPICVYTFYEPMVLRRVMRVMYPLGLLAYFLFFLWHAKVHQCYLAPIFFVGCFLPITKNKHIVIITFALLFIMSSYRIEAERSQFIKAVFTLVVALSCTIKNFNKYIIRFIHLMMIVAPFVLLYLGITGVYSVFEEVNSEYEGEFVLTEIKEGIEDEVDMVGDTRTFIYYETIKSAIDNNYVLFGRTPARGHDAISFYDIASDFMAKKDTYNIKHERPKDEVCFPNIFTWLGLVGLLLYMGIYLYSSYLAVYRSNSYYVKLVGLIIAFNFFYGWVENTSNFDILNFVYWFFISIGLSPKFRNMSDKEFKEWFASIFSYKSRAVTPNF